MSRINTYLGSIYNVQKVGDRFPRPWDGTFQRVHFWYVHNCSYICEKWMKKERKHQLTFSQATAKLKASRTFKRLTGFKAPLSIFDA